MRDPHTVEYPHRPVRAGGDPAHGVSHDVICARCLVLWPCSAHLKAQHAAAAAIARHFERFGPTFGHAGALVDQ
jgi:hypothetical protein